MSISKLLIKPVWWVVLGVLLTAGVAFKLAVALTAFVPGNAPIGYVGQDEVTNFNLKSGNEVLFRGQYEREFWSGTLLAYRIDSAGNLMPGTSWWTADAGEQVSTQNHNTGRLIATMTDLGAKVPFRTGNLSASQLATLGGTATQQDDVLDYLRGDRSKEFPTPGGLFRQRVSVMGAVVHSRPFYVADDTNPTVFVGANDGMLHAINAGTGSEGGKERWAYVPSMLIPKMRKLSVDPYLHDYYVDGQINVSTINSGTQRVLVGGLGGGGKGLYALDITGSAGLSAGSETAVANKVLWEITPTAVSYTAPVTAGAYENLGYTYGTITIAKVKVGLDTVDAVIVGNGYNDGGDYGSYLFVINATTGQLIKRFKAGSGSVASPNGLSTPVAIDENRDGIVETAYAGDLDGTMWRFDLSDLSDPGTVATTATAPGGVKLLLTTSPAQPITSSPGVAIHPNGGYMVTFGTGKALIDADLADTTVHYVYGIWDGAPVDNDALVAQTLTERDYLSPAAGALRVRRVTSNQPNWASGVGNHKGWKVALPAGERVLGEGTFIENGRYYFTAYNPTKSTLIAGTVTTVVGDNWLMELDYLTGGSTNDPFLDLSGNVKLDTADRLLYTAADTIPAGLAVGDPIMTTDGIPVGKFISIGVLSQPILVQLVTLNDTLFNQNPDVIVPPTNPDRGVEGGHFDVEVYYGRTIATITVTGTGQTSCYPANLGAITVDGVEVVPNLTVADLQNGVSTGANATAIKNKVKNGFTATVSGNVVTIRAPDPSWRGKTMGIAAGAAQTLVPGTAVAPTALMTFSGISTGNYTINNDLGTGTSARAIRVGGSSARNGAIIIGAGRTAVQAAATVVAAGGTAGLFKYYVGGNTVTPLCRAQSTSTVCIVDTSGSNTVTNRALTVGSVANPGGLTFGIVNTACTAVAPPVVALSGSTNLKPALTVTAFDNGSGGDPNIVGDTCNAGNSRCTYQQHDHEYDDLYDKTGVNFLNASNSNFNLSRAIGSTSTQFKVIAQNQYLSPAVRLHIGNPGYLFNVDSGYSDIKFFTTSATLDLAALPTYTRNTIGSLAFNLPPNAFTNQNWWKGHLGLPPDVRDGLHPTEAGCVFNSASATQDGNMYQPVIPPATVTASGNGTRGWGPTTTQLTAQGVRHNGAITIQLIRADTPNSAIELSVPGRPEYGWRVKAGLYSTYVIASYSMFHHTKHLGVCYGEYNITSPDPVTGAVRNGLTFTDRSWTKTPVIDGRACTTADSNTTKRCAVDLSASAGPDPKIGNIGGGSGVASVTTVIVGNVTTTTITFLTGLTATITRTVNDSGSITIRTWDVNNTASAADRAAGLGADSNQTIANKSGAVKSGGDERGLAARTGRISWRELIAP